MGRSTRLMTSVAVSLAVGLLAAGCAGNSAPPDDAESPTSTQSPGESASGGAGGAGGSTAPTESSSPTPEPATSTSAAQNVPVPEMPEEMTEPTEEGLEAALEYWYEASHYLKLTGDDEPLADISGPDCSICSYEMETWPGIYEVGGWTDAKPVDVDTKVATIDNDGKSGTYLFEATELPASVYREDGTRVAEASSTERLTAGWSGSAIFSEGLGHWYIESLSVLGPGYS